MVLDQIVLGAGFGLMSTSLLVGAQSSVAWNRRGVVTGGNMFSRYLGQSFGVAVFGAIFNTTLDNRLANAPAKLRDQLPKNLDHIMSALQTPGGSSAAESWLRHSIYVATHHLYIGLVLVAILTLAVVLIIPRHFAYNNRTTSSKDA